MGSDNPNPVGEVLGYVAPVLTFTDATGLTNTGAAQSTVGQQTLDAVGIKQEGPTLNEQLAQLGGPNEGLAPPNRASASNEALKAQRDNLRRVRASRTLFTGGQGVLDSGAASSVLLGI